MGASRSEHQSLLPRSSKWEILSARSWHQITPRVLAWNVCQGRTPRAMSGCWKVERSRDGGVGNTAGETYSGLFYTVTNVSPYKSLGTWYLKAAASRRCKPNKNDTFQYEDKKHPATNSLSLALLRERREPCTKYLSCTSGIAGSYLSPCRCGQLSEG